ncbi:MAG: tRNA (N(6)-L-threonylcarbamoyladenosine(37)-C(2))-methylthiotransferase MtaB [Oscillospiraceae bacterium]|jgi:threonylcarbamoyladenosine tRNA methylthiotransferase MtaB
MKFKIYTLGCKVNQFESQAMEKMLRERGFEEGEPADAYIINTCTVTAESDRKSRQIIRRARKIAPGAVVAVCGCYSQTHGPELTDADVVFGTGDKQAFVESVCKAVREKKRLCSVSEVLTKGLPFEKLTAGSLSGRTRSMLKVQDGCQNFCAYCIIPYARGPIRSLPLRDAVDEAKRLAGEGCLELIVTGIEISSYGLDTPGGPGLIELTESLCAVSEDMRIRLGSLEPRTVTEEFCRRLSRLKNLCDQFHLSLQSGSDSVLRRMGRKYDTARYYESVTLLREYFPGCAVTTDVITGFPGETEEEFDETLEFIKKCAFARMHVFPYSKREGTRAATMPGQVERSVREERAHRVRMEAKKMSEYYMRSCINKTLSVLFETDCTGHAPNYTEVRAYAGMGLQPSQPLRGQIRGVFITGVENGMLIGELAE